MKTLMLGNAAIARGLYEAGCRFVSSYPGTPSTEITECVADYKEVYAEWAPNEKVAVEAALGAAFAGSRSFAAMKHVGLNVAADPLFTASYTGVNGGLVICVADDPGMHSSQNEQDSRHYAEASKIPMLEPADSQECIDFVALAYEISEKFDTPVLLRTATRIAHSQSLVELKDRVEVPVRVYEKNPKKYVAAPANAIVRHGVVEKRQLELAEYTNACPANREELRDTSIGFVCSGACYQYVREAFPNASVYKVGMCYPVPVEGIRAFRNKVEKMYVAEELDPFLETALRVANVDVTGGKEIFGLEGELSQRLILERMGMPLPETVVYNEAPVPVRPPVMCPGCPHRGLFAVLSKMKLTVIGDIGCYTLGSAAPLNAVDTVVCMGASVSGLHGFTKSLGEEAARRTVGVIGDSTFMHSGITGLVNMAYNKSLATLIVVDNSITGMTGHQQNPTTGLTLKNEPTPPIKIENICRAVGIEPIVVDPCNMAEVENALKTALSTDEASVIISRRPCALLKYVKHNPPLKIDPEKCKGCKMCMKLGCPAIRFKDGKAVIDDTQCVGCSLCVQSCKFSAIEEVQK